MRGGEKRMKKEKWYHRDPYWGYINLLGLIIMIGLFIYILYHDGCVGHYDY